MSEEPAQTGQHETITAPGTEKPAADTAVSPQSDSGQVESPSSSAAIPAEKKKVKWGTICLDTLLVLMLMGAMGGGAWFINKELENYRVPTPMETAQAEHLKLCKQHESLQNEAYQADEQLHMRQRIVNLDLQIKDIQRQITECKQAVEEENSRISSLQREIRQEDKTSRTVAKNLIIGLPIGNAATTTGKAYPNATIHRLERGRITLRTPYGQSTFPSSQLVKDNLPDMVRYAFGLDDLIDMSDFEAAPKKRRKGKLITPRKAPLKVTEPSYEPESAPVVNTQAPSTITVEPGLTPEDDGSWQAPQEPLPIAE